jgi:phosphatidate cytidylyltransferase
MLRQRLIAAALGLPMLFALLWLNWWLRVRWHSPDDLPLLLIVLLIAGISGWEVSKVVQQRLRYASAMNGVYAALIIPFMVHAIRLASQGDARVPVSSLGLLIDSVGVTAVVMFLFLAVWSDIEHRGWIGLRENLIVIAAGVYLGGTTSALLLIGETPMHEIAVAVIFATVFAVDTAAYFGGLHFDGPALAPHISPKKTVSGAVCGLCAAVVFLLVVKAVAPALPSVSQAWWNFGGYFASSQAWWQLVWLGISVGILGQIGDLVESSFKRWGQVKDSGHVLPGHGGFLDRFDSLFLAAPVFYLMLVNFLHLP